MTLNYLILEFSADKYSAKKLGYANSLRSALIKQNNGKSLFDDCLYSVVNSTKPPVTKRIEALKRYEFEANSSAKDTD